MSEEKLAPEKWKEIPSFLNYEVSTLGGLRRIKKSWSQTPKRLKPYSVTNGYHQFQFYNNGNQKALRINRVVLEVFDRDPIGSEEANHKNGDTSDDRLCNLEWLTPSGNMKHSYDTGLHPKPHGEKSHFSKLTQIQVDDIRVKINSGIMSMISIAIEYGVSRHCIYRIRDKKSWRV